MTRRFCQDCGAAAEPAAVFCATCGTRLAAPPGDAGGDGRTPAPDPAGARAAPRPGLARLLVLATFAAIAILAGGAVVLDRIGRPADPIPNGAGGPGASPTAATVTSASPGPPTVPATASPPPAATPIATFGPDATLPIVAAETPLGAVAAFLDVRGIVFAGACSAADPIADTGSYCTELVEERPGLQVHWIGPAGSEPDTWLLVAAGQYGWAVIEWAPVDGPDPSPPF